jgi:hypothetical protein
MNVLLKMISNSPRPKLFSGQLIGVRSGTLSRFATDLGEVILDAEFEDVEQLRNIGIIDPDRRYSAEWSDAEPRDIVKIIADSTRGSGSEKVKAFA